MNEWKELLDFERVFFEEVAIKLTEKWTRDGKCLSTILRVDYDLNDPDMTSIEIGKEHVIYFEVDDGTISCLSNIEVVRCNHRLSDEELEPIDELRFAISDPETTPANIADRIFDTMGATLLLIGEEEEDG